MGGVDVDSGKGGKRATNSDINMVPFIDLLMVTIAFLLITAVWVTNSRINADAQVPGPPNPQEELTPQTPEKVLNLLVTDSEFAIVWKQGATVISDLKIPKNPVTIGSGRESVVRYPDLAKKLDEEWKSNGGHRDASDKKLDQCILSTENKTPFKEIVAVLDALYTPKREMVLPDNTRKLVPAFNMTFSAR
jgi:biopolymer transport protein ExbD